jgi:hypothetical protein
MNRVCFAVIAPILTCALAISAQQTSTEPAATAADNKAAAKRAANFPSVEGQMKVLTDKLGLTVEQQNKVRPVMADLHDYTVKLIEDQSLSEQERLAKVRPRRIEAGKKLRELLTEEQNKKLDAYLRGPHREMHGDLSGEGAGERTKK